MMAICSSMGTSLPSGVANSGKLRRNESETGCWTTFWRGRESRWPPPGDADAGWTRPASRSWLATLRLPRFDAGRPFSGDVALQKYCDGRASAKGKSGWRAAEQSGCWVGRRRFGRRFFVRIQGSFAWRQDRDEGWTGSRFKCGWTEGLINPVRSSIVG